LVLREQFHGENKIKATPDYCQVKNKALPDAQKIFYRILQTLGAKNAPEAARILGLSKQSVYDWQKSVPSLDNLLRIAASGNTSLHWLVTGEGPERADGLPSVTFDAILEAKIRAVVREELKPEGEDDIGGEVGPIEPAEMILAPVVARITGGETKVEKPAGRHAVQRMIDKEDIDEIEKRLKPRRKKTG
jgi:hypothetical protein